MNTSTRQAINDDIMPAVEFEITVYENGEQFADDIIDLADENWDGELPGEVSRDDLIAYWKEETENQRTLDALETEIDLRTMSDHYTPDCPICGMSGEREDGEVEYACGHFVGVYNDWSHPDELRYEYTKQATHRVNTSHELAGENDWFFATTDTDDVMSAGEAAKRFNLSESAVRQTINRGQIKARKSGGTWLIRRADAEARWGKK